MLSFLRRRVLPWAIWVAVMTAAAWLYLGQHRSKTRGFVEVAAYSVTAPQTGRLVSLTVQVGQHVSKDDVIAVLDGKDLEAELGVLQTERMRIQAELAAVATNTQVRMSQATRGVEESIDAAELEYQSARSERRVKAVELEALSKQLQHVKGLVDKGMADRRELARLEVSHTALEKELQQADVMIRKLQRRAGSARARRGDVPADATARATGPLRAELAVLDRREQLLTMRLDALVLKAPGDGEVTAVHLRGGEVATEGAPIVTITGPADAWRAGTPTVRVCVDEGDAEEIAVGEAVELSPGSGRGVAFLGRVVALSPDVAELPTRCWHDPRVPRWGRSVYVVLDDPIPVLPGQSFGVEFLGRMSSKVADEPEPLTQAPTIKTIAEPAAPPVPEDIVVPAALKSRSRFEPSGVVWVPALDRYVVVSDDTGHRKADEHAPLLFTMDREGRVDEVPLRIEGLDEIRDVESIAPAPDGGLYVLSSLSYSRKGRRDRSRTLFVRVALAEGRATVAGAVSLAPLFPERGVEIEGMTASADGGLFLGLKAPLTPAGEATIWYVGDPDALLTTGDPAKAKLRVWGTVPLQVIADGAPAPGGISELLELPDRSLLVAATASLSAEPEQQDGILVHVPGHDRLSNPLTVATFPGLKPEGLSLSPDGEGIVIVFDTGEEVPRWVEQPWPAS